MNVNTVVHELIVILKECQALLGHDDADSVNPKTRPHGGMKGFQSDIVPTIVRRLARKLGHELPADTDPVNIFASDNKKERLTVEEAAKRYLERFRPKGTKP